MLIVAYAVGYVHTLLGGDRLADDRLPRLPAGAANTAMTFCNSFYARVYGYLALLTDEYPPIGDEKGKGGGAGRGARAPPIPGHAPPASTRQGGRT